MSGCPLLRFPRTRYGPMHRQPPTNIASFSSPRLFYGSVFMLRLLFIAPLVICWMHPPDKTRAAAPASCSTATAISSGTSARGHLGVGHIAWSTMHASMTSLAVAIEREEGATEPLCIVRCLQNTQEFSPVFRKAAYLTLTASFHSSH
jgi:hypothetical protein